MMMGISDHDYSVCGSGPPHNPRPDVNDSKTLGRGRHQMPHPPHWGGMWAFLRTICSRGPVTPCLWNRPQELYTLNFTRYILKPDGSDFLQPSVTRRGAGQLRARCQSSRWPQRRRTCPRTQVNQSLDLLPHHPARLPEV